MHEYFLRMQLFVSRPIALNQALKVIRDFKDIKDFNVVKVSLRLWCGLSARKRSVCREPAPACGVPAKETYWRTCGFHKGLTSLYFASVVPLVFPLRGKSLNKSDIIERSTFGCFIGEYGCRIYSNMLYSPIKNFRHKAEIVR